MGALYQAGPNSLLTFLFLTVLLGGAASLAAGRALAATWRPASHCVLYAAPIAAAIAFLHFALFEESVIPFFTIGAALAQIPSEPLAGLANVFVNLRGFLVLFVIHSFFAAIGYRLTRQRQMKSQYGFSRGSSKN